MSDALAGQASRGHKPATRRPKEAKEKPKQPAIDIYRISAAAFRLNLKKEENTCFATSIFEIDRELGARTSGQHRSSLEAAC
jgi:hypothetical protein